LIYGFNIKFASPDSQIESLKLERKAQEKGKKEDTEWRTLQNILNEIINLMSQSGIKQFEMTIINLFRTTSLCNAIQLD
jgi:hypothetical protein